ncbi:MAG: Lsr2 family protein [Actinomycetota bacterium]|nr:Lsr2 family protein [Actinomycetota bacterium]
MARKTTVHLIDDVSGGDADETVSFGFRGTTYEVDLSAKNATALEKALSKYMDAGRKVQAARSRGRGTVKASGGRDLGAVRSWAREKGYAVSDRGRIPGEVWVAYDATKH